MKERVLRGLTPGQPAFIHGSALREILTLVAAVAIAASLWFLRGSVDDKLIDSKSSQISSLQATLHSNDELIAQSNALIESEKAALKADEDKLKTTEDELSKAQAKLDSDQAALKSLADTDNAKLQTVQQDDNSTIQSLQEKLQAANQQVAEDNEKLVQVVANYETELADLRNRTQPIDKGAVIYPEDNGFDSQDVGTGFFSYRYFGESIRNPNNVELPPREPNRTPWVFTKDAGIGANNCGFYVSNATNGDSDGKKSQLGQAAFLEFEGSSVSQKIKLPAGTFSVTFGYEARRNYTPNEIAVLVDDKVVFKGSPADTEHFVEVTTDSVKLPAGKHELRFLALGDGSDAGYPCTFIDNVRINVVAHARHPGKAPVAANDNGT